MELAPLFKELKEKMIKRGTVIPCILVEIGDIIHMVPLTMINDDQIVPVQCGAIARTAWDMFREGEKLSGQKPTSICSYGRVWYVPENKSGTWVPIRLETRVGWYLSSPSDEVDMQKEFNPASNKNKQEVLIVSLWQATPPRRESYFFSIQRDQRGKVTSLGEPEGPKPRLSLHLTSFIQGIQAAHRDIDEVIGDMDDDIAKSLQKLSPQKLQALGTFLKESGLHAGTGKVIAESLKKLPDEKRQEFLQLLGVI